MRIKIILGIITIICGIVLFAFSGYITQQVAIGRGEISAGQAKVKAGQIQVNNAQRTVNTTNQMVDNASKVNGLGGLLTTPVQQKIDDGQEQINAGKQKIKAGIKKANYYEELAGKIQIAGVILMIIGALILVFSIKFRK